MAVYNDNFGGRTLRVDPGELFAGMRPADDIAHCLVMASGVEPGKRLEIGNTPLTIGRSQDQSFVIADGALSRRHARVYLVDGHVFAEDLGSTNGTFVNAERITTPRRLDDGASIRIGDQILKYERRSRQELQRSLDLDRDLLKARQYVVSLLPKPWSEGSVTTNWCFVPSAQLGGDVFGYYWLDSQTFVVFLADVSGHGVGAAMHSVAILEVLRERAIAGVDWRNPGQVLSALNDRFQMDNYNGMLFTIWYGVYDAGHRQMSFSAAGHHPAYLVSQQRDQIATLGMKALMLGAMPHVSYGTESLSVPTGSALYLFSDGAFEITAAADRRWSLRDFVPLLSERVLDGVPESERLFQAVRRAAGPNPIDDDCSIVVATFS